MIGSKNNHDTCIDLEMDDCSEYTVTLIGMKNEHYCSVIKNTAHNYSVLVNRA